MISLAPLCGITDQRHGRQKRICQLLTSMVAKYIGDFFDTALSEQFKYHHQFIKSNISYGPHDSVYSNLCTEASEPFAALEVDCDVGLIEQATFTRAMSNQLAKLHLPWRKRSPENLGSERCRKSECFFPF